MTSTPTCSGSRRCGVPCSTASTPTRLTSGTPKPLPRCRSPRPTCRSACRCSATPGCRAPRSNCSTRWPPTTTFTCGCRTPATTCGVSSPATTAPSPAATTPATATSATRCWPPSAATCANCSAACPPTRRPTNISVAARHPDTLLGWLQSDITANAVRPQGRTLHGRRPLGAGAQLPRPRPPDRRAARSAARPARRRQHPRTARHPRHVPGHRDLRAADRRGLRARRRRARRASGTPAAGQARRPRADADQPAARRRVAAARTRRRARHRQRGAQSRRGRAGAGPLRASATTTSTPSPTGCARPTSAGVSTGPTATRTASTSSRTPGVSASTGCWRAWRCPTTRTPGSTPRFRSTTSAATASSWPAGSPSTSSGCSTSSNRSPAHGHCANGSPRCPHGITC